MSTIASVLGRPAVHPFPARMAPGIALRALSSARPPLRVLDPMSGSGTVLAIAQANGHQAFGCDIDPLSVLVSRVWTTRIESGEIHSAAARVHKECIRSLSRRRGFSLYPRDVDDATREFMAYWFDRGALRQLTAFATAIEKVAEPSIRDALWCAFSRMIITKDAGVSRAMDVSHSRPHRVFDRAPAFAIDRWAGAVKGVVAGVPQHSARRTQFDVDVQLGDARTLTHANASIDLVITSPPYLNAIDYLRASKFSLVWMRRGVDEIRLIRGNSVGAEVGAAAGDPRNVDDYLAAIRQRNALPARINAMLRRYALDLHDAIGEVARVLKVGGRAIYVVGDSTLRGIFIANSEIVRAAAAAHSMELVRRSERRLPDSRRYLPPPSKSGSDGRLKSRMRREVVMEFSRE